VISELFIRKPVATSLLTIAIAVAGILAFNFLPVAPIPQVEFPTISVGTGLPGANPETMASSVATPLERQFGRIAGITEMTSSSSLGATGVTLQFDLSRSIDAAARDVQASINAARGQLPANLPSNPVYRKINPADSPVLILALTSDTIPVSKMYDIADSVLAQKLAQVPGIGQAEVGGGAKPAVRILFNPTQLNKYSIGSDTVRKAMNQANANQPVGQLSNDRQTWELHTTDQLFTADQYRKLIIAYKNNAPVRLGDVSEVLDSVENRRNAGFANGKQAVLIILFKQTDANIIETVDRVYDLLPRLRASIPPAITLAVTMDRTTTIRASIRDVEGTLVLSIGLVILVVFVFLRNLWATFIPSVAVPLSLLGTCGVMYLLHYSLDNLSLMALTVSTGFVVDDAIVVIENISRYREMGMGAMASALRGAKEISFTVVSMSVSLVAVFLPILLMGGIVGRLFREFAVTLAIAVTISLVVSLSTTPMMCSLFLRAEHGRKHNLAYRASESVFEALLKAYDVTLTWVLRHPQSTLAVLFLTIGFNVYLYVIVPKGFFPQQDTGRLMGSVQASQDISFPAMREKVLKFLTIVKQDPAVQSVSGFVGGGGGPGGGGSVNSAFSFIMLKPLEERGISADAVIERLRPKLSDVPGATQFMQVAQEIRVGGRMSNTQYQYTLSADSLKDLNVWAPKMVDALRGLPQLTDVNSDQQTNGKESTLVIDRDTAARFGITPQMIDDALYDSFGQRQVSTMYTGLNQYHVVLESELRFQQNPDGLKNIYVKSKLGTPVPLSAFTSYRAGTTALTVNHQGQFPATTISFNLTPNVALGDAVTAVQDVQRQLGMPANVRANFAGAAQAFQDSLSNQPILILSALVTVYLVLGMLYESFVHPLTILSTLPSAGVGAILALILCNSELNVISLIGIVLLIGLVKKNAIMMIDVALDAERNEGKTPKEAIYKACMLRFRPILMTTMAALLGGLPLALGTGTGSELRRPLGITIVGGLMFSQVLTLYTTPVVYLYLDRLRGKAVSWRRALLGTRTPAIQGTGD
jgi:hydrophobe/amphiphile efflux-1 (HAE1) family protein